LKPPHNGGTKIDFPAPTLDGGIITTKIKNSRYKKMKNNKKIIFGLFILSLILGSTCVFGAATSASGRTQLYFPDVDVTMINYDPNPAEAGRYVTIRFKIENIGAETAQDIVTELLPKYPFSLDPGESAVKNIGSVRSRQSGDTGVIIDYRVKVDENALEGDNEIELRYKIKNGAWIKLEPLDINVNPHDILLSIASVDAPNMIKPGEISKVDINLENLALTFIKEIKVRLNLGGVPFAPIGSTDRKIVKQMEADSNATVSFNLMAEPGAESNLYKVPIEIEFLDRLGVVYTKNETVGLIVGDEPDLAVNIDSSEVYSSKGSGEIIIKIVNKGVTDVKFLNVELKESDNYRILSPKEVYVGNIDSDDYETADFDVTLGKVKGKDAVLILLIEYKDANNNDYSKNIDLPLKLYSASEAKSMGLKKGNNAVGIIIVLIIVGVGFFIYIRWRKKKKGEKVDPLKIKVPFFKKKIKI
jgi:hypothetical protein